MSQDTAQHDKDSKTQDDTNASIPEVEWQQVSEEESDETKIVFDTLGDEFIGVYLGKREVPNEDGSFWQHRFAVGETKYFVNGNHSLNQGMTHVAKGSLTRLVYLSDKDTGAPTPMKVYGVYVGKMRRARTR